MEKRNKVLEEESIESEKYIELLIRDVCGLIDCEEMPIEEVLNVANLRKTCLEASFEEHIGDEENINAEFVKNHLEILYFYPIKNDQSFGNEEALKLYMELMGSVLARFENPNTLGKFSSVNSYIKCFD